MSEGSTTAMTDAGRRDDVFLVLNPGPEYVIQPVGSDFALTR